MILEGVELGQLQVDDLLVTAPGRLLGLCRSGLYGGFCLWRLLVRSRRCLCRFLGLGRFLRPGFLSSRWGFLLLRGRGCFLPRLFLLCRRLLLRGSRLVLCLFGRAALPLRRFRPLFLLLLWGCLFRPFGGFFFGRSGSRFAGCFPVLPGRGFLCLLLPRHDFGEVVEGHVGGLLTFRGLHLLLFGNLRFLFFLRRGGLFRLLRLLFRGRLFRFLCCLLRSGHFRLFRRFLRSDLFRFLCRFFRSGLFRLLYRFFRCGGFGRFLLLPRSGGTARLGLCRVFAWTVCASQLFRFFIGHSQYLLLGFLA